MPSRTRAGSDPDIETLFRLPLAEFTRARNALAARLKKDGRPIDAGRVKALAKPPATAWAVNQLYWQDPAAFDRLADVTERARKAQSGRGKSGDLRSILDEKKRIVAALMERAAALLRTAGHAASPEAMRRVSGTLEALGVWGKAEDAPKAGRLEADLDPPGFEVFAAGMGGTGDSAKVLLFRPARPAEDPAAARARAREALQAAEKALRDARREADQANKAVAKANDRTAAIEKQKQEIEARYAEAREAAREAATEAKSAAQAVAEAERRLAKARAALE